MTNRLKRFPASFRFVAVTFALIATASLATSAAADPPSAQQVQNAKDRVTQLAQEAHAAQRQLDAINIRANEVAAEYDRELGRLEKLNAELLHTQLTLAQARARYDAIVAQLNDRARTMFMEGPASDLEFLLGASSFSDLTDRLEYVNVVASNDADLANEVQNTKNVLSAKEQNLESLQAAQQAVVAKVREKQREIADLQRQATAKYNEIASKKAEAEKLAKKLSAQRQAWVNAHFSFSSSPHASVAMPPGWAGTLQVCPVGQPRAYGDGFGAPRYAGGYHLHAGVDILAPMGTPIYATFDGYATREPERARRPGGRGARRARLHVQRAPVRLLRPLDRNGAHGRRHRVRGRHGRRAGRSAARPFRVPPELVPVGMAGELLRLHGHRERAQPLSAVGGRLRLARVDSLPRPRTISPSPIRPTHAASTISTIAVLPEPPELPGGR